LNELLAVTAATEKRMYWTIKQNWDGKLWPRLWPNERYAWRQIEQETGNKRKWIEENCDWTLVQVELKEVTANAL